MKVFSKLQQKLPPEFENAASLTIAAGAITVAQQFNLVDTEASAASDDLTTINGVTTFKVLYLRPTNSARTVVVKHNVGNIKCFGDADITLDDNHDCVILVWDEIGSVWCALAASASLSGVLLANATVPGTGIQEFLGLNLTAPTELTIATGAITLTQGAHTIDTEGDAASDDLVTINAAKGVGDIFILVPENDARTIVLKHGTGNIHTFNGADVSLNTDDHWAILFRIGTRWLVLANGGAATDSLYAERSYGTASMNLDVTTHQFMTAKTNLLVTRFEAEVPLAANGCEIRLTRNGTGIVASQLYIGTSGQGDIRYASMVVSESFTAGDLIGVQVTSNGEYMGSGAAQGPLVTGIQFSRT